MASITLAEASKLSLDDLVVGVIENIVEINPIYYALPFNDIMGNAKTYNRENALGDVQVAGIDGTISAKAAATYSKVTSNLTTIIGDAEVNGLLQAQRVGGDIAAAQIASKAKNVGRYYQWAMMEGVNNVVATPPSMALPASPKFSRDDDEFDGLRHLITEDVGGDQVVDHLGASLTFEALDEMLHRVKSKDGHVDAIIMNAASIRAYRTLVRSLGGSQPEFVEVAGVNMPAYAGVPIYRSDWVPNDVAFTGSPNGNTYIAAVNFDDGSEKVGIAGLTAYENMGIHVQAVGPAETKDNDIWRVKFYASFAAYSALGAAFLTNVTA